MNDSVERVVFDCNVFAQALIKPSGPAGACVELVLSGKLHLFWSDYVIAEIHRIPEKATPSKMGITSEITAALVARLLPSASLMQSVPHVYDHPFDPKDSHYINLAVATNSRLIASSDKHLLNLMNRSRSDGSDFLAQFPRIEIMQPWQLLARMKQQAGESKS